MGIDLTSAKQIVGTVLHIFVLVIILSIFLEYIDTENYFIIFKIIIWAIVLPATFFIGILLLHDAFTEEYTERMNVIYALIFSICTALSYILLLENMQPRSNVIFMEVIKDLLRKHPLEDLLRKRPILDEGDGGYLANIAILTPISSGVIFAEIIIGAVYFILRTNVKSYIYYIVPLSCTLLYGIYYNAIKSKYYDEPLGDHNSFNNDLIILAMSIAVFLLLSYLTCEYVNHRGRKLHQDLENSPFTS